MELTDCQGTWRYAGRAEDGSFLVEIQKCDGCGEWWVVQYLQPQWNVTVEATAASSAKEALGVALLRRALT